MNLYFSLPIRRIPVPAIWYTGARIKPAGGQLAPSYSVRPYLRDRPEYVRSSISGQRTPTTIVVFARFDARIEHFVLLHGLYARRTRWWWNVREKFRNARGSPNLPRNLSSVGNQDDDC